MTIPKMHDDAYWAKELEDAIAKCRPCGRCIPIGKRSRSASIRDGRFDTQETCCHTRSHETGCPVSTDVKLRRKQEEHDVQVRADTLREAMNRMHRTSEEYKILESLLIQVGSREYTMEEYRPERGSPCIGDCGACSIDIHNRCNDMINPDSEREG